jgi:hypothetical protein
MTAKPSLNASIAKAITDRVRIVKSGTFAKQRAASHAGHPNSDECMSVDQIVQQRRLDRLSAILDDAVRAGSANHSTAVGKQALAKAKRIRSKAETKRDESFRLLQKATAARLDAERDQQHIADATDAISGRLDVVTRNLCGGLEQVAMQQARRDLYEQRRIDSAEADWAAKAASTTDPLLRAGYLERLNGSDDGSDTADD